MKKRQWMPDRLAEDERGVTDSKVLIAFLGVIPPLLIAVVLLTQTLMTANHINTKAERIAKTGRGINLATDSVIQLGRTNETASSILETTSPLEGKLGEIGGLASSLDELAASIKGTAGEIDGTAGKINATAGDINVTAGKINTTAGAIDGTAGKINTTAGAVQSTAGKINATAKGINSEAVEILATLRQVDSDVAKVNAALDSTIGIANAIKGDTGNILVQAREANQTAACIDRKVGGAAGNNGCG
ncbi:MAG: hypothetical protein AB1679_23505 [Actinomycetota bacterium]